MESERGNLEVPCLGRPFSPGLLYDARSDKLLQLTLWNEDKLKSGITTTQAHYSDFKISVGHSLEEKLSLLNLSGHLKLGFLGGLIEAKGSASYLNQKTDKRDVISVLLVYRADVESQKLDMKLFDKKNGIDHQNLLDDSGATHVVMQTTYGANAVFEFKKEGTNISKKKEIKGGLRAAVNKIPGVSISGDAKVKRDKNLQELTEDLTVSFQGDFIIKNSPTTYEEAITVYKDLPAKLMEIEGRSIRPLTASLVPLKLFNPNAQLLREISDTIVKKVENAFVEIDRLEERLVHLRGHPVVEKFRNLEKSISQVQDDVAMFHLKFKSKIRQALPKVRSSHNGEDLLVEILDWRARSPCRSAFLEAWTQDKEDDTDVIDSLQADFEVYDRRKLNRVLLNRDVNHVVALVIKRYGQQDQYSKIITDFNDHDTAQLQTEVRYFPMMDKREDILHSGDSLLAFAENNRDITSTKFVILEEALADGEEEQWQVCLKLYGKRKATEETFVPPPNVRQIQIKGTGERTVTVLWRCDCSEDELVWVTGFEVRWQRKQDEEWNLKSVAKGEREVNLEALSDGTYNLSVCAVSDPGRGQVEETTFTIQAGWYGKEPPKRRKLLPPPKVKRVQVEGSGKGTVRVSWLCDCSEDELVWVSGFEVRWRREQDEEWGVKTATKDERDVTLGNLSDGKYQVSVCSVTDAGPGVKEKGSFVLQIGGLYDPSDLSALYVDYGKLRQTARYKIKWGTVLEGLCYHDSRLYAVEWKQRSYSLVMYQVVRDELTVLETLELQGEAGHPRIDTRTQNIFIPCGPSRGVSVVGCEGRSLVTCSMLTSVGRCEGIAVTSPNSLSACDWDSKSVSIVNVKSDTESGGLSTPRQVKNNTPYRTAVLGDSILVVYIGPKLVLYKTGVASPGTVVTNPAGLQSVSSITTDGVSRFLLCDWKSRAVFVLDVSGVASYKINVNTDTGEGYVRDCTVGDKQLWVGCRDGDIVVMA